MTIHLPVDGVTGALGAVWADPAPAGPRPISADAFKDAFRAHPGGVALISAAGPDGPAALTATSVSSVSADPPLLAFSVSRLSSAYPTLTTADSVVVHLLGPEDLALARLGSTSGIDRFADGSLWSTLPTGEPFFHGPTRLRSLVVARLAAGTATLVVAQPVEVSGPAGREPIGEALVYHGRTWHRLGDHSRIG